MSREVRAVRPKGNAQADSDDAKAAQENASVRVSGSPPLCGPAFAQVAADRRDEVRRSDAEPLGTGSWDSPQTVQLATAASSVPRF